MSTSAETRTTSLRYPSSARACNSREDAEKFALEAIEFTLEEENDQPAEGAEVITYDVQIAKAS